MGFIDPIGHWVTDPTRSLAMPLWDTHEGNRHLNEVIGQEEHDKSSRDIIYISVGPEGT